MLFLVLACFFLILYFPYMLWIIKLFFIIKRRKVTYIMGRELMGLASCDDDRKAIINFTIVAAKYFNDQVTVEKINDSLKEYGQAPLTEEEKKFMG